MDKWRQRSRSDFKEEYYAKFIDESGCTCGGGTCTGAKRDRAGRPAFGDAIPFGGDGQPRFPRNLRDLPWKNRAGAADRDPSEIESREDLRNDQHREYEDSGRGS